jgi:hypothetical protein
LAKIKKPPFFCGTDAAFFDFSQSTARKVVAAAPQKIQRYDTHKAPLLLPIIIPSIQLHYERDCSHSSRAMR